MAQKTMGRDDMQEAATASTTDTTSALGSSGAAAIVAAKATTKRASPAPSKPTGPVTLAVDIGGTGIKAERLDPDGKPLTERLREQTPKQATPSAVVRVIKKLAKAQGQMNRVSVGFPGVVKDGVVYTAPNLGKGWNNFDLRRALERKLGKPARVANDADVQGLGSVSGRGVELVITLGTGFGSVIFVDGHRIHLELGHAPFRRGKTYEDELGIRALQKKGKRKWNKVLGEAITELAQTFDYDRLKSAGGNARHSGFNLPDGVKIVSNEEGLLGGIKLWNQAGSRKKKAAAKNPARSKPRPA
jgi:polyphosphate glucokinase